MKRVLLLGFLMLAITSFGQKKTSDAMKFAQQIEWFGQACIKIPFSDKTVYVDPFNLPGNDKPDMVFITHGHGDHLNVDEIAKLASDKVMIVAPTSVGDKLKDGGFNNLVLVKPGDQFNLEGINVEVVPAYNVVKTKFHPKSNSWVGYIITYDGVSIYHPGDTERIPEMKQIDCDIAFMPLGQTYTMNSVEEAVNAVKDIEPLVAIPFHYGIYEGKEEDAQTFKSLLSGTCDVLIKPLKKVDQEK